MRGQSNLGCCEVRGHGFQLSEVDYFPSRLQQQQMAEVRNDLRGWLMDGADDGQTGFAQLADAFDHIDRTGSVEASGGLWKKNKEKE